jgi:hypothetical protein
MALKGLYMNNDGLHAPMGFPPPPKRKTRWRLPILIVAVVAVLGLGVALLARSLNQGTQTSSLSNAITIVCSGSKTSRKIKNAAAYEPNGNAQFTLGIQGVVPKAGGSFSYTPYVGGFADKAVSQRYVVHNVDDVALVGCINRHKETKTSDTCQFKNNIVLDIYKVDYKLDVYAARSGELVRSVDIPSKTTVNCDVNTIYNASQKRMYQKPSDVAINDAMKDILNLH